MRSADWVLPNPMRAALDRTQRMIGFAFCFGFGLLLSLMVGCCARSIATCYVEAGLALLLRAALDVANILSGYCRRGLPFSSGGLPFSRSKQRFLFLLPAGAHVSLPVIQQHRRAHRVAALQGAPAMIWQPTADGCTRAPGFSMCPAIESACSPSTQHRPTKFASIYALGSIMSLSSTLFLVGPFKQIKRMFDGKRWVATSLYLGSLVCTLVAAIVFHSVILCLLCIIVQFCAFIWYAASYVPYAQAFILRMLGREADTTG
ncbi:hypothetical protein ABPG77_004359 [Micractinium sp. CCAP 211/92]